MLYFLLAPNIQLYTNNSNDNEINTHYMNEVVSWSTIISARVDEFINKLKKDSDWYITNGLRH